ncbi:hypothetical protein [Reyranella massiliensis]|uniref:hypothetical protein n=1 Tax=Reyranella massiliensis TaxID=445220 RepID=UPI0006ACF11E|nr:hypothetical protein [Reyranella massiliensis]
MNLDTGKAFLRCLGLAAVETRRTGWLTGACPLGPWRHRDGSGRGSFGLKLASGLCTCFSCHWHGVPFDLLYEMRHLERQRASGRRLDFKGALAVLAAGSPASAPAPAPSLDERTWGQREDFVFPESWLAEFEPAFADGEVHPYLAARRVPYEVAAALDLRFDPLRQRLCFPVRDYHGRLRGLHGRTVHEHVTLRYLMYTLDGRCSPEVWLGEAWADPERPLVVVESVFDLARVYEVWPNVVCPLTASLGAAKIARLSGVRTILPMFDRDAAGHRARDRLMRALPGVRFLPVELPHENCDPADLTAAEVRALLAGPLAGLVPQDAASRNVFAM